jgi:hypothetical protein
LREEAAAGTRTPADVPVTGEMVVSQGNERDQLWRELAIFVANSRAAHWFAID